MEKGMPHIVTNLECPILGESRQVELSVNVFRRPDHKGLDVEACSEFLESHGAVTCGKACIHTPEARRVHEEEGQKHQEELGHIGKNVIG